MILEPPGLYFSCCLCPCCCAAWGLCAPSQARLFMINLLPPLPSFLFTWNALTLPLQWPVTLYSSQILLKIYYFWKHLQANSTCFQSFWNFMIAYNDCFSQYAPYECLCVTSNVRRIAPPPLRTAWGQGSSHIVWIPTQHDVLMQRVHWHGCDISHSFMGLQDCAGDKTMQTCSVPTLKGHKVGGQWITHGHSSPAFGRFLLPSEWNSLCHSPSVLPPHALCSTEGSLQSSGPLRWQALYSVPAARGAFVLAVVLILSPW